MTSRGRKRTAELAAILGEQVHPPDPGPRNLTASELEEHAVVEAQPQLWHPGQKHLESDGAHDLAEQDAAVGVDLRVTGGRSADARSPAVPAGPRDWGLTSRLTDSMTSMKTSFFLYLIPSERQDTALVTVGGTRDLPVSSLLPCCVMYLAGGHRGQLKPGTPPGPHPAGAHSLLQDLAVCGLRVAEVHELVQQLVDDDEVVADTLLLQLLEVLAEDLAWGDTDTHMESLRLPNNSVSLNYPG